MSPPTTMADKAADENETLLAGGSLSKSAERAQSPSPRQIAKVNYSSLLLLLFFPLLLLSFIPLKAIFHRTQIIDKPHWTLKPGTDVYKESHPDDHGAAWKAEHGDWATQGPSLVPSNQYKSQGKLRSNGSHDFEKTVILVSLDGVRADYLTRGLTPHLLDLSEKGMRANHMISVFPSLTFPNHWSMQTGLYPESHGIVANDFWDPITGREFLIHEDGNSWDSSWWQGEPIWSTVTKSGMKSAVIMWPGPPKMADGTQPTYWRPFQDHVKWPVKKDIITNWLDKPIETRPNFIAAYVPEVDQQGHLTGPDSAELEEYLLYADNFAESLHAALQERNLLDIVDIIFVSDHGMTATANERVVYLDTILGQDGWDAIEHKEGWPSCGLRFKAGTDEAEMLRRLRQASQDSKGGFQVYTHQTMPEQYHFTGNPRIAPIYIVPEIGWVISNVKEHLDEMKGDYHPYGNHGYDPEHEDMHAIFVAHGPFASALRRSRTTAEDAKPTVEIEPFRNVELYGLVMRLLDIPRDRWAPTNGTGQIWETDIDWSSL